MHSTARTTSRIARSLQIAVATLVAVTSLLAVTASPASADNRAWGLGLTCWQGQLDVSITVQGAYDGQWVAYRTYMAKWDPATRTWPGTYSAWTTAQDPAGAAAAVSGKVSTALGAGTHVYGYLQVAFHDGAGWSYQDWSQAGHTTNYWSGGRVVSQRGSYCSVT